MKKLGFICLKPMDRLTLISWFWLLKKTSVITTNLNNPESASDSAQEFIQIEAWLRLIFFMFTQPINSFTSYRRKLKSRDVWKMWFIK